MSNKQKDWQTYIKNLTSVMTENERIEIYKNQKMNPNEETEIRIVLFDREEQEEKEELNTKL